jgi:outer membrane protein assembly factor BamB
MIEIQVIIRKLRKAIIFSILSLGLTAQPLVLQAENTPGMPELGQPLLVTGSVAPSEALNSPQIYLPVVLLRTGPDWPMAGANPQRTSWTAETLPGNIRTLWVKPIVPYVSHHVQVVGATGKVFVSTAAGLYAFDANTGAVVWVYPTELPLGHSPTYANGVLYVGGVDRRLHAVAADSGQAVWTFTASGGFYTNPVVVNGKVYAGNRDGALYAVDASNGQQVWKYQTGNQSLQSPAYQDGVLYFASNDGYGYALDSQSGNLVWRSATKLPGMGHYSWWPVIYQDYVIFTRTAFEGGLNGQEAAWIFPTPTSNEVPGVLGQEPGDWVSGETTIDVRTNPNGQSIPDYFETFPHRRNAVFLNRRTGQEVAFDLDSDGIVDAAPISWVGDAGTRYPPIVSGSDGVLYFRTLNKAAGASFSSATLSGWKVGTPFMSLPYSTVTGQSGFWPADEPAGISAAGNMIYAQLCCDRLVAAVDISRPNTTFPISDPTRQWRYVSSPGLPFYTQPSNIGIPINYYQEAAKFFWDPPYPAIFWNENDKVGPAIYQGKLYVILGNALVAFGEGGAGSNAPILSSAQVTVPPSNPPSLTDQYLKSRLEQEISEIVAAGHLKPSYSYVGLLSNPTRSTLDDYTLHYWHNPADIHVVLLRALPHLSTNLQQQVRAYLQSEMAAYSPALYSHIGWTDGVQRDPYIYPPTDPRLFTINFGKQPGSQFSGWGFPPHNLYALWKYAQAGLGNPQAIYAQVDDKLRARIIDTPDRPNLTDSYLASFPHVHNAYIAGYRGYIELAKLAGRSPSEYGPFEAELNRLLTLRAQNLTIFPTPTAAGAPDHDYFDTMITAWNFMYLTPELADYLHTHAQTRVSNIVSNYQAIAPYWMVALNGETQGENALMPYQQTHSLFQAIAMIRNAPRTELKKYLDTPIVPVGDLYYIDNLVSVLEAP